MTPDVSFPSRMKGSFTLHSTCARLTLLTVADLEKGAGGHRGTD